jgi:hypothetical protein
VGLNFDLSQWLRGAKLKGLLQEDDFHSVLPGKKRAAALPLPLE